MANLVTPIEIVEKSFANQNIDLSLIKPTLIDSIQERYIRPYLGNELFDLIVAESQANIFTGLNETLLNDYIKDIICNSIAIELINQFSLRLTSKGVLSPRSDTSNTGSRDERTDLIKMYQQLSRTGLDKMERFLTDNDTSFPLWLRFTGSKIRAGIIL